jgi:hypothetical protein
MTQRRVFGLFLVTLLACVPFITATATASAAQTPVADDQLAGLQAGVWRGYAPAGTIIGGGPAFFDDPTPMASVAGKTAVRTIDVVVREFDTPEHAAAAFVQISEEAESSLSQPFDGVTQEITSRELSGVGTQAILSRNDFANTSSRHWIEYATVQRDTYVILVSAIGFVIQNAPGAAEVDTSLPTEDIAIWIAANGAPSPDAPVFAEDGSSTGGLWGFMPENDDPMLMGLVSLTDVVIYPVPAA